MSRSIYGVETYQWGALLVMRAPSGDFVTVRAPSADVARRVFGQVTGADAPLGPVRLNGGRYATV